MNNSRSIGRIAVNGKLLTVRQSEKFVYFMENSETFRTRFMQLSMQTGETK